MERICRHWVSLGMHRFRMICSDIDGTLLDSNRQLAAATIAAVQRLPADLPFLLISSRMPASMRKLQETLGILHLPLIAYNGSLITDGTSMLYSRAIPTEMLARMHALNAAKEVHISLYHYDEWLVPQMDYWAEREARNTGVQPQVMPTQEAIAQWQLQGKGSHKIMCMGDERPIGRLQEQLEQHFGDDLHIYRSKPTYLEISDRQQDKAAAIQTLLSLKYADISLSEVLAFGDNHNDTTMLQAVGCGVAVANAVEAVQAAADAVTFSHVEDGVARYLNELFSFE